MRYVIVLDFGYPKHPVDIPSSSIRDLAEYAWRHYGANENVAILAQEYTYGCLIQLRNESSCEVDCVHSASVSFMIPDQHQYFAQIYKISIGQSTTTGLENGGAYHVLREAARMITELEWQHFGRYIRYIQRVTLVAHRLHASRASLQAKKLGLIAEIPSDLPTQFHSVAAQWWCRNQWAWYLRELIGYIPLKLAGQI